MSNTSVISYFFKDSVDTNSELKDNGDLKINRALLLVEGEHTDSAQKVHVFSKDRIQNIVQNTNSFLRNGGRIPWQKDHVKTQDNNIGDLEDAIFAKVITYDDLPNPKFTHLVGKVGVFANKLVAKGVDVVQDILNKRIKTLSPGIDIVRDILVEVSATPTPAINGPAIFSRNGEANSVNSIVYLTGMSDTTENQISNFALTFDEAEMEEVSLKEYRSEYDTLCDIFWNIVNNITNATEEDLQGEDPEELLMLAFEDFQARLQGLFGLNTEEPEEEDPEMMGQDPRMASGYAPGASPNTNYLKKQQGINANMTRYYNGGDEPIVANFSLSETAAAYGIELPSVANFKRGKDKKKRMRKGMKQGMSLTGRTNLGKAVRAGAALGAGAAALRYGGAGVGGAMRAGAVNRAMGATGRSKISRLGGARGAAMSTLKSDLGRIPGAGKVSSAATGLRSRVGSAVKAATAPRSQAQQMSADKRNRRQGAGKGNRMNSSPTTRRTKRRTY